MLLRQLTLLSMICHQIIKKDETSIKVLCLQSSVHAVVKTKESMIIIEVKVECIPSVNNVV